MSSTIAIGQADEPTGPEARTLSRHGVAVWCDRAILGHGVAAVVGRSPQFGRPRWIGDGLHEPPQPHHLLDVAVLVAVWDSPGVWPALREQLPSWLATGVSVVLVGPTLAAEELAAAGGHPRLQWCSPHASAAEITAVIVAAAACVAATPGSGGESNVLRNRGTPPSLSVQEQRVLELVTTGLKISAVARRLDVSPHTVHTYLRRIRRKLAEAGTPVASPLELYRAASLWRLVEEPIAGPAEPAWPPNALGSTG